MINSVPQHKSLDSGVDPIVCPTGEILHSVPAQTLALPKRPVPLFRNGQPQLPFLLVTVPLVLG